jgi:hypothetical protein
MLKLISYIKHPKLVVLIDSGITHNFIQWSVIEETHCYVYVMHNFHIMISNGGMLKCGGKSENVCL